MKCIQPSVRTKLLLNHPDLQVYCRDLKTLMNNVLFFLTIFFSFDIEHNKSGINPNYSKKELAAKPYINKQIGNQI